MKDNFFLEEKVFIKLIKQQKNYNLTVDDINNIKSRTPELQTYEAFRAQYPEIVNYHYKSVFIAYTVLTKPN